MGFSERHELRSIDGLSAAAGGIEDWMNGVATAFDSGVNRFADLDVSARRGDVAFA